VTDLADLRAALEQVDWDALYTRDGSAEQFPDWIMQLASRDEAWRVEGIEALWRTCSPPCPATAQVVPFLLYLLESDGVNGKSELLHMLASFTITPPTNADEHAAREAVYHGLNLVSIFLESDDPDERDAAVSVLSRFPDEYPTVRELLRRTITDEPDPSAQIRMIDSYAAFIEKYGANPDDAGWIAQFATTEHPSPCRLHAAQWAIRWTCDVAPDHVVDTLMMAILYPEHYAKFRSELLYGPIVENACDALCRLSPERAIPLLIGLLPQVRDPDDAHILASRLLDLAFNGTSQRYKYASLPPDYPADRPDNIHVHFRVHKSTPERQASRRRKGRYYPPAAAARDPHTLTDVQRAALAAVVESDPVWLLHSNLLEIVGLPASRSFARDVIAL
jgi:hypothetical protein